MTSVRLQIIDDQDRHFSLIRENLMRCVFTPTNKDKELGWCNWVKRTDKMWYVSNSSRGKGTARATYYFGDILDDVHTELIIERELLR